jgi:hypothetical protein
MPAYARGAGLISRPEAVVSESAMLGCRLIAGWYHRRGDLFKRNIANFRYVKILIGSSVSYIHVMNRVLL